MRIDESGESIELNVCGHVFLRVSRYQARHDLKNLLWKHWGLAPVLSELVMDFAEPKWHAAVAVYDSLPEAGWLIESVREQVFKVVVKLAVVFGNDPDLDKEVFRNSIGLWGRHFS